MVVQVLGLGPKPCDVNSLEVVQQATFSVQKAIDKYDGTITRLITDDKGTRFLIAFGLPGHQHDNDEARAVLLTLAPPLTLTLTLTLVPSRNPDRHPDRSVPSSRASRW